MLGAVPSAGVEMAAMQRSLAVAALAVALLVACSPGEQRAAAPTSPTFGPPSVVADHREVEVRFPSHGTVLVGTLYLPSDPGTYPALVWVHGSGKEARLMYGGPVVPAAVQAR